MRPEPRRWCGTSAREEVPAGCRRFVRRYLVRQQARSNSAPPAPSAPPARCGRLPPSPRPAGAGGVLKRRVRVTGAERGTCGAVTPVVGHLHAPEAPARGHAELVEDAQAFEIHVAVVERRRARRRPRPAGGARTRWTASRPCRSAAGMRRRARRRPRPRRRGSRRCRRPGRTTGLKAAELAQGQHARLRRSGPPPVPRCRPRAPAPARRRGRAGCTAGSAAHRGNGATGRVALSGSVTTAASAAWRPGASMRVRFSG
jgi:hypothetical protein